MKENLVIMYQKKVWNNLLFHDYLVARNYIKMNNPRKKFTEKKEDVLVCSRTGATFEIIDLQTYKQQS